MRVPTSTEATTALHRQAAFAAKRRLAEARGRIAHKSRFVQRENSHKAETKAAPIPPVKVYIEEPLSGLRAHGKLCQRHERQENG